MKSDVERKAIEIAIAYLERKGYKVENVSKGKRRDSQHRGYDLFAEASDGSTLKVEVKGCSRRWGIPDPYSTEFEDGRLAADFLYVIYLIDGDQPTLCEIPRDAILPEYVVPRAGYRISGRFKNEKSLGRYLRSIS